MQNNVYLYILAMAATTYLIRAMPFVLLRKPISNVYVRSFLHYVPYITLSIMIFPAILSATSTTVSAGIGFAVAILVAYKFENLFLVAGTACLAVFFVEFFV